METEQDEKDELKAGECQAIFVGTGTSTGTPQINCLIGLKHDLHECVCHKAVEGDPCENKNNRLNPSILLRYRISNSTSTKYVLFDCCKTFREAAVRWFRRYRVPHINAVLLSHGHADATLGIDDLRMVINKKNGPLSVYLSEQTYKTVNSVFPYLVNSPPTYHGHMANIHPEERKRQLLPPEKASAWVAKIDWRIMSRPNVDDPFVPVNVQGLQITPFPVYHGKEYLSLGFMLGESNDKFVYISDISSPGIPEKVFAMLESVAIQFLIVDAISEQGAITHQSIDDAVQLARKLRPVRTILTGISHRIDHDDMNHKLAELKSEEDLDVQLAYDGLVVDLKAASICLTKHTDFNIYDSFIVSR
mmetsp:Transcript_15052/g.17673  ORF Transcript_15052/g.17673 Transcript_15052/m.17673 type:complete len:362 (+) Transcript_15052:34-1119(+)